MRYSVMTVEVRSRNIDEHSAGPMPRRGRSSCLPSAVGGSRRARGRRFVRAIGVLGIAAAWATLAPPPAAQVAESPSARHAAPVARPAIDHPPAIGGAPARLERQMRSGFASPAVMPQTAEPALPAPLWYDQNPRLLRADHAGGLSLDDFLVAGDVPTLTFERLSLSAADDDYVVRETWRRTGTTAIDGHLISVFRPSWDDAALWDAIAWQRRGFDHPYVQLGVLLVAGDADTADGDDGARRFPIRLRTAPLNVPEAEVTQIDAETQYASHVVNLVMPEFGDRRLAQGDYGHELEDAARRFYAHFSDEYASMAFIPRQQHVVPYDAFHHNVRNPIAGLGALPVFNDTAAYGSAGVLRSVELYPNASFTSNASSTRAISRQWVDYWDWSALAGGIDRAGRDPENHTPLLHPGEVYAGAVLDVTRRVAAAGGGNAFTVERTPAPAMLHPTTLYRMGLIGPEAVPELLVFENQGQFDEAAVAAPAAGTPIEGGWRRVHVNDILAEHGPRRGPVDDAWSRVSVVVSRDGLLSAEEISYWNFFAAPPRGDRGHDHVGGRSLVLRSHRRRGAATDRRDADERGQDCRAGRDRRHARRSGRVPRRAARRAGARAHRGRRERHDCGHRDHDGARRLHPCLRGLDAPRHLPCTALRVRLHRRQPVLDTAQVRGRRRRPPSAPDLPLLP